MGTGLLRSGGQSEYHANPVRSGTLRSRPGPRLPRIRPHTKSGHSQYLGIPDDDGRAAYLLAHFGEILRYVPELGQWRIWHGQRWHPDSTGRAGHYCQLLSRHQLEAATCRMEELANELSSQIKAETDPVGGSKAGRKLKRADVEAEAKRNRACATALGNEKTISAMLAAASRVGHVIVPLVQWDANPWLVGTANGRLDLSDQTHAPGIPGDYMTRGLAVAYDPRATAPQWEAFIALHPSGRFARTLCADYRRALPHGPH